MDAKVQNIQRDLAKLQKHPLSIIKLSEQLRNPTSASSSTAKSKYLRASSNSAVEEATLHGDGYNPSPSSLASDLEHYRALFKKLHFSYLEQVSKEKFLRAIVGDPPQVVDPAENAALEGELAVVKAELSRQKADVDALVKQLEAQGRNLAARHEGVQLQTAQLGTLPQEIAGLRERIAELEGETARREGEINDVSAADPRMRMSLAATREALEERQAGNGELDREIAALRQDLPNKARQIERLENELRPLESQRNIAAQQAEEALARKERRDDGIQDQVELRGRWYQGSADVLRELVGDGHVSDTPH